MQGVKTKRVLLVDDERDLTDVLALRLTAAWGYAVFTAYDGAEGLRKAAVVKPDVILVDLAMPEVDGWEMCRRLRDDPETRSIPVVVMTAWSSEGLHERAASEGVSRVLLKPVDDQELLTALRELAGTEGRNSP